jgi:hypothetical protein
MTWESGLERQEGGRDIREAGGFAKDGFRAWAARDERHGVAGVPLCGNGLDVAVVARQRQGEAEFLGEGEESGEEGVEGAKDFCCGLVAARMSGAVREEVLEERVVVAEGDLYEVLRRFGWRYERPLIAL